MPSSSFRRLLFGVPFALAMALSACGAIPLSTATRLSTFDERDLASLDPQEIRVRVAVPEGYTWDVERAKLEIEFDAAKESRKDAFQLARVSEERGVRESGVFGGRVDVQITTLRLSDQSIHRFRELQRLAAAGKARRVHLNVEVALLSAPPGATSVKLWIETMLSQRKGYFLLIDGGTVRLNTKEVFGAPRE